MNNVVGQAVGNLTGAQKGFSWASVAAAGVGAAAGAYAGNKVGTSLAKDGNLTEAGRLTTTAGTITAAAQGATASIASQLTSVALQGGRFSWSGVAVNAIGAGAGYLASGVVLPKDGGNIAPAAQAQSQNTLDPYRQAGQSVFTGERINVADGSSGVTRKDGGGLEIEKYAVAGRGTPEDPFILSSEIEVKASKLPILREEVIENANRMLYQDSLRVLTQNGRIDSNKVTPVVSTNAINTRHELRNASRSIVPYDQAYRNNQTRNNAFHYQAATNVSQELPGLGIGTLALKAGAFISRTMPVLNDWRAITAINGGLEITGQAINTDGFTNGSYRPDQTLLTVASSLALAKTLTYMPINSSLTSQYAANAMGGGVVGLSNTYYGNVTSTNGDSKDITQVFVYSSLFGTLGKAIGQRLNSSLDRIYTPYYAGTISTRYENGVSGITNFLPLENQEK
ncbi:hypothetical protein LG198_14120 [Methylobacillus arboreus]|uniref:hypothetical protein n=1 Tax=Methylobacillus arboreus TaxID=755170 RepID=UPI001E3652B1|nr:hypothetical protein [Methylobacillus arboreus]MCB5191866.1 hypothetical protein [Methylobacillus arboreus]